MLEQTQGEKREQTLGRQVIEILLDSGCITHRFYKGKSGLVIPLKVEIDRLREKPAMHKKVADLLWGSASENFPGYNYLVAVPTGGISLVKEMHGLNRSLPRARPRVGHGFNPTGFENALNYPFSNNSKIVIVEDVVTKGTSSRKTLGEIKNELKELKDGEILGEVTVFTYGFVDNIDGVEVRALSRWDDLIDALRDRPEDIGRIRYLERWHAEAVSKIREDAIMRK